jgi:hypothetical protein
MAKKKAAKETFIEPDVEWKKSKAKRLLYKDIVEGKVPPDATDADGRSTMQLSDIYVMHPEFAEYDYAKFSSRLSSLRAAIVKEKATAKENEKFKEPKVKWKKSKARRLLYKDIVEGKVPPDATDADGRSTMQLSDIYLIYCYGPNVVAKVVLWPSDLLCLQSLHLLDVEPTRIASPHMGNVEDCLPFDFRRIPFEMVHGHEEMMDV